MIKTNNEMMDIWNNMLKNNKNILKIINYKNLTIFFNNNHKIIGKNEIQKFVRRIIKIPYFIDKLYNYNPDIRLLTEKIMKSEQCKIGGISCQKQHPNVKNNLNNEIPWNKGKQGLQQAWNKGLTKKTNNSLKRLSENRVGCGNPNYGKIPSDETKKKQSNAIKQKILDGSFTPNIHNSRTHKLISFNGCKYRSSWEVLFARLHPECEFEKIRIKYFNKTKNKIHITDFVDIENKIIYEIKPKCHKDNSDIKIKISEAIKWCKTNGYTYKLITENELFENLNINVLNNFDNHTKQLLMRAYEAYKKNRN